MENKQSPLLALVIGILIGANWPKIEKLLKSYLKDIDPQLKSLGKTSNEGYSAMITFLAQQKEKMEDLIAEAKIKKVKREEKETTLTKRTVKRKTKASKTKVK